MMLSFARVILFLTISIASTSTSINNKDCVNLDTFYDANQCTNQTIHKSGNCFGYNSCYASTISTQSSIKCKGAYSCKDSPTISTTTADATIGCIGYQSCMNSNAITTINGDISCLSDQSCFNSNLLQTGYPENIISCQGPNACSNSRIDTQNMECQSKSSCQNSNISYSFNGLTIKGPNGEDIVYQNSISTCSGSHSCQQSLIKGRTLYCYGRLSCSHTYVQTIALKAYGILSAFQSNINGQHIDGYGYKSLVNSIIDTYSRPKVTVNAYGYFAGKNAVFICRSGAECKLSCKGNGCKGMKYQCESGAKCSIVPRKCGLNSNRKTVDGISCPNFDDGVQSEPEIVQNFIQIDDEIGINDQIVEDVDHGCDDSYSCKGDMVTDNPVFNGYYSCQECDIRYHGDIDCIGYGACYDSMIRGTGNGDINCLSGMSCAGSDLVTNEFDIECNGYDGCKNIQLLESKQGKIDCSSTNSCKNGKIQANKGINCDGLRSCQDSEIIYTGNDDSGYIKCSSQYSCINAKLTSKDEYGQIVCSSDKSCHNTVIKGNEIIAMGNNDLYGATVTGEKIYGFGYQSLSDSIIDSGDLNTIIIFAYGHETGKNAKIHCRKGANCELKCKSDGCLDLNFNCESDAVCTVSPNRCKSDNSVEIVNGIYCPTFVHEFQERSLKRLSDGNKYVVYGIILGILLMQLVIIWEYKMKSNIKQIGCDSEHDPLLSTI